MPRHACRTGICSEEEEKLGFKTEKVSFKNKEGHTLDARLELPDGTIRSYAIFVHCFTCSKNVHAASRIARALTETGIGVLRFDFTGLGNSEGDFSNTNFTTTVSDLSSAYNYMKVMGRLPELLIGHSLGGATVIAAASGMSTVKGIITINSPAEIDHVEKLFGGRIQEIEREGKAQISLAGRPFTIKKQFLDDIRSIELGGKISGLKAPLLIFHSPQDEVVSFEHAKKIFDNTRSSRSLISLDGASHLLDKKEDAEYVSLIISAWEMRYLD